jgi:DNA repair exonuclease SbcCD ATPase subunit
MKIISLSASNIKRLKAVYIEPDGTLQVVSGRNAQGKTSVLDSIWLALGGGAAMRETAKPVRDGEDTASVRVDLGDLVVTRTWKGDKTSLTVTSAEGAKYTSPQKMLDDLVGRLSFDPLAFTRLSDREQVAALLELVDLDVDLDALDADREFLYAERTELGRQGKALGDVPAVDKALPDDEVSASSLLTKIRESQEIERNRREFDNGISFASQKVTDIKAQIAELEADLKNWKSTFETRTEACAALPAVPDITALESDLEGVEAKNAAIRTNNEHRIMGKSKAALVKEYEARTTKIDALDSQKSKALAAAKFPVDGLGFTDDGVTYNGVPFSQASSAEQAIVSMGMAMALNPKLRVIRIFDGSLLDADSMQAIADMAAAQDYQVIVERVDDASPSSIIIEDGEVVSR